jgi:CO/xanthine dehydrogenase Mo-binding subunit
MNTHVKIATDVKPADLSRRSFLVGTAAAGLALGYSAVPGMLGADQALAAASNFDPSVWYSIAPDGIVTVTCGKADMGQHIASTMAQIVSEELGSSWKDMRVQLASNDPKFNDPVLGAQITGGSWSTMMNFESMSRAGAAGRIALTEAAAVSMGVPSGELVVRDSVITHPKSKKIRHRRHAAGHGLRQGGDAAGALRRHGEVGRRQCGQEGAGLHQGRHPRRQDRQHVRLGGGGRQYLCQRPQGGGRAEDQL